MIAGITFVPVAQTNNGDSGFKNGEISLASSNRFSKVECLKSPVLLPKPEKSKVTLESFARSTFTEYSDFANQPFEILKSENGQIHFQREGGIFVKEKNHRTVLDKSFQIEDEKIKFSISLESDIEGYKYLQEHNLHFANLKDITINTQSFDEDFELKNCDKITLHDEYTGKTITYTLNKNADIFISRLDTLSQSEAGFDLTTQGISIGFLFDLIAKTTIIAQVEVS